MQALQADTRIKRTNRLLETEVDGEVVALDVENGQCYGLDAIGTDIWQMLGQEVTIAEICQSLTERYEVDEGTCLNDVTALVEELRAEGLVAVCA